jgi:hypothetical protein
MRAAFYFIDDLSSLYPSMEEGVKGLSGLFYKGPNHIHEGSSSKT